MNGMIVYGPLSPPKLQNIEMLLQWWFNRKMKIKHLRNDSVKLIQLVKCSYVEWCSAKVRD